MMMAANQEKMQSLICNRQIREAFHEASKDVLTDKVSQVCFLQILRVANNVAILQDDMDSIRKAAEQGNPYMQLAYGRLHECLMPGPDSVDTYVKYYESAMKAGIADARAYRALSYRDGDFGEVDLPKYHDELKRAMDEGSERAAQQIFRDRIFGNNGIDPDPRKACDDITKYIEECKSEGKMIDPCWYSLMADADRELGRRGAAMDEYETAFGNGYMPALFNLAFLSCCDDNGNVVDKVEYEKIMDRGRECACSDSFLTYSLLVDDEVYDDCTDEQKEHIHKQMEEDLAMVSRLGDGLGCYYLGTYSEEGAMGFRQDFGKAFPFYLRGSILRNTSCYEAVVRMILDDHTAPEEYDEHFAYDAAYRCLMLGGDTLEEVIRGYKNGFLTEHASAIEQIYLPRYEQEVGDIMDDHDIDDDDEPIIDDPESFHAAEREVEEDDWTMDPDIDMRLQECVELAEAVKERVRNRDKEWENAGFIHRFMKISDSLLDEDVSLDSLSKVVEELADFILDHPRLKLDFLRLQHKILRKMEEAHGENHGLSDEVQHKIALYEQNIALADAGRLNEIPQSGYLKKDPVEWTKKWEEVVDEAERIACSHLTDIPRGMGFCFSYWAERKTALAKLGVEWRTPHQMNPRVIFD